MSLFIWFILLGLCAWRSVVHLRDPNVTTSNLVWITIYAAATGIAVANVLWRIL